MEDFKWLIGFLLLLVIVWFSTGGPTKESSRGGPFIKPPPPLDTGETYGIQDSQTEQEEIPQTAEEIGREIKKVEQELKEVEKALGEAREKAAESPFKGKIALEKANARRDDPKDEYVVLRASSDNKEDILITGWKLKSLITGKSAEIKEASLLLFSGAAHRTEPIFLPPGGRVFVLTGRSPKGVSFRLNKCTGHFEQFQDFTPSLPKECPGVAKNILPAPPNALSDACLDYLERIPRCYTVIELPWYLSPECQDFIRDNYNYSACVKQHKNDLDFYKNEWRVYLGRDQELWKEKREVIELVDANNKTVDAITY
jgi:hypothetical protein